jgi:hypothetical protein
MTCKDFDYCRLESPVMKVFRTKDYGIQKSIAMFLGGT